MDSSQSKKYRSPLLGMGQFHYCSPDLFSKRKMHEEMIYIFQLVTTKGIVFIDFSTNFQDFPGGNSTSNEFSNK